MSEQQDIQAQTEPVAPVVALPAASPETPGNEGGQESVSSRQRRTSLFDTKILRRAALGSLIKLNPRVQARNPVMFVVEIGSVITTIELVRAVISGPASDVIFTLAIA